jgi:NADH-quinone oxidoreductase subunit K
MTAFVEHIFGKVVAAAPVGLSHYLVVAAMLFVLGLVCVLTRKNAVAILLGIELLLNAAALNMVAFSHYGVGGMEGPIFVLFLIVLAAAEAIVGMALVMAIHRRTRTIDMDRHDSLKG